MRAGVFAGIGADPGGVYARYIEGVQVARIEIRRARRASVCGSGETFGHSATGGIGEAPSRERRATMGGPLKRVCAVQARRSGTVRPVGLGKPLRGSEGRQWGVR